ncbi:MAG: 3-isopropylmalate dehydratase small subunit [Opitutales bacterium]|jgi:3-isopropylmalate/(R)-2-methylmalate dehydratase small subunit
MSLAKITEVQGRAVEVPGDDIDTDRIIPARFMKCVTFDGLGEYLFHDVRFDDEGSKKDHNLNDPRYSGASIMLSGVNFGCGSSREHAPQSLYRAGFRAVIAGNFAEIFFGNSTNLGIPCVSMSEDHRQHLGGLLSGNPDISVTIDLGDLQVRAGDDLFPVDLRAGARDSLMNGMWDPLDELLLKSEQVDQLSKSLHYI